MSNRTSNQFLLVEKVNDPPQHLTQIRQSGSQFTSSLRQSSKYGDNVEDLQVSEGMYDVDFSFNIPKSKGPEKVQRKVDQQVDPARKAQPLSFLNQAEIRAACADAVTSLRQSLAYCYEMNLQCNKVDQGIQKVSKMINGLSLQQLKLFQQCGITKAV